MTSSVIFINILLVYPIIIQGASIAVSDTTAPAGTGKFWQLTDVHWDFQYSVDGNPRKMCHAAPQVSDTRTSNQAGNGHYGNYLCDAPWPLVRAGLDAMVKIEDKPDFILWTGDIGPHVSDPRPSFEVIFRALSNVTHELLARFPAPVTILPVLGNHDAFPQDDFPNCPSSFFERYLTEGGWDSVLTVQQQDSFKRGGYYSYDAPASVKVIVLNTNMYYFGNELGTSDPDPCGQFSWLLTEMDSAQQQHAKVMLVGHAPPGFFERFPIIPSFNFTYNEHYMDLVEYRAPLIHSHVYGHLHTDSFRIYGSIDAGTSSVAFMAPSLTPWQANMTFGGTAINPSLRLYSYDSISILDYTQYHLNLTRANEQRGQAIFQGSTQTVTESTSSDLVLTPLEGNGGRVPVGSSNILRKIVGDQSRLKSVTAEGDPDFGPWEEKKIEIASDDSKVFENVEHVTQVDMIESTTVDDLEHTTHHWLGSRDLKKLDELLEDSTESHLELFKNPVHADVESPGKSLEMPDLTRLKWDLYYEAREAYSLDRLDGQNMNKLYASLRDNEDQFDRYYERNSAGFSYHDGPCRGYCRQQQICAIKNSRVKDLFNCMMFNRTYVEALLAKTFTRLNISIFDGFWDSGTSSTEKHMEPALPEEPSSSGSRLDICSSKSSLSGLCFGLSTLTVITGFVFFWLFMGIFCSFKYRNRSSGRGANSRLGTSHGYRPLASDER
ncbi:Calcineurin-like phosphoesterase domain ApaH type [Trinorchestia longiramus]|nr:Calcineurin-like phosphoesterase domain ApaH type [Trinorchestia longiramus]